MINEIIWDKTNIGENYPGITSPLTYSFIRNAYARVYTEFLALIGVDKKKLNDKRTILYNLLGYVHGQVYYNINNWYELVKILPGYKHNKIFFETMLNPAEKKLDPEKQAKLSLTNIFTSRNLIFNFFSKIIFIKPLYRKFDSDFNKYYSHYKDLDISKLTNSELVSFLEELEDGFFRTWANTIVNDFRVMIFYGVLVKMVSKAFPDTYDQVLSEIYGLKDKPLSVVPLRKLLEIVKLVRETPDLILICTNNPEAFIKAIKDPKYTDLNDKFTNYIENFGERSFNELKLEEVNFKQNPEYLINIISTYVNISNDEFSNLENRLSGNHSSFTNYSFLMSIIRKVAISSIFKREEFRLKRSKVFQIAREIYLEFGSRLVAAGDLDDKKDIFYLYCDEVLDYVRFHRLPEDFINLVSQRKNQLNNFSGAILARRITTNGLPSMNKIVSQSAKDSITKIGRVTSRGKMDSSEVVVMQKLDLNQKMTGKILVTKATDPGWTIIFPMVSGIIIEEGGMLSHASILAREFGIPCIVLPGATTWLKTGDQISMDAFTGEVKKKN